MSTTILENGWIKIDFSLGTDPFTFSDALHLPGDHGLSDAEIEAMKQSRYDNWLAIVNAPPPLIDSNDVTDVPTTDPASIEAGAIVQNSPLVDLNDYVEVNGVRYYKAVV